MSTRRGFFAFISNVAVTGLVAHPASIVRPDPGTAAQRPDRPAPSATAVWLSIADGGEVLLHGPESDEEGPSAIPSQVRATGEAWQPGSSD